jgi:hypothetical protein
MMAFPLRSGRYDVSRYLCYKKVLIPSSYLLPSQKPIQVTSSCKLSTINKPRTYHQSPFYSHPKHTTTMSGQQSFSNADTGSKPADPYKSKNKDNDASLDDKVAALSGFMNNSKFSMMTTRDASSGHLVSRCMALAAQVRTHSIDFMPFYYGATY